MIDSAFSALPAETQIALARLSDAVDGVRPAAVRAWPIDPLALVEEATASSLLREVSDWASAGQACLYYVECRSADVDLTEIAAAFAAAKARKRRARAYPRLNSLGTCLYVGSSRSMGKRLREHLGYGAAGTYALQLAHWATPLSLELDFVCAKYAEDTRPEVMQALEDTLWQVRRPMFGRRGAR
ncbi:MAG TPA: hypothetical protein PLQ54_18120 [Armatimonadota bacterium]|nr:hypothetical protein [Armatimonadota bacterium]